MKENTNKILVQCELPTDYGMPKLMKFDGLPLLNDNCHYVITEDNRLIIREYFDDGFSYEDKRVDFSTDFNIIGEIQGGMGLWKVTYRVILETGKIKNIYELNADVTNNA